LAEFPGRIEKLFDEPSCQDGKYVVNLTKNGEKVEVEVNDYFPCRYNKPIFSKCNGNELWVLILEKVWAKIHHSYKRIESGFAYNAFRDLTGAPSFSYIVKKTDDIWQQMVDADKRVHALRIMLTSR